MRKITLIAVLALTIQLTFAQSKEKYVYCEIVGTTMVSGLTKVKIVIDYGDKESDPNGEVLYGKDNKPLKFNSMVGAMNYLGTNGWEFVQAYAVTKGNSNVYHYLMRKPFEELDPETQKLYLWE